jgi:IS30 family transposase
MTERLTANDRFIKIGCQIQHLSQYTQQHLDEIALKLNTRPRKTLDVMTLAEKFNQGVALNG